MYRLWRRRCYDNGLLPIDEGPDRRHGPVASGDGFGKFSPAANKMPGSAFVGMDRDQRRLDRQLDRVSDHLPEFAGRRIVWLRRPSSRWVRAPLGILLIIASLFSFLPVLGMWMLPLGLMLLAIDVPFLKRPTGRALVRLEQQWVRASKWYRGKQAALPTS
jgi:hypothetical protein